MIAHMNAKRSISLRLLQPRLDGPLAFLPIFQLNRPLNSAHRACHRFVARIRDSRVRDETLWMKRVLAVLTAMFGMLVQPNSAQASSHGH